MSTGSTSDPGPVCRPPGNAAGASSPWWPPVVPVAPALRRENGRTPGGGFEALASAQHVADRAGPGHRHSSRAAARATRRRAAHRHAQPGRHFPPGGAGSPTPRPRLATVTGEITAAVDVDGDAVGRLRAVDRRDDLDRTQLIQPPARCAAAPMTGPRHSPHSLTPPAAARGAAGPSPRGRRSWHCEAGEFRAGEFRAAGRGHTRGRHLRSQTARR